jgi:hypothetical protein
MACNRDIFTFFLPLLKLGVFKKETEFNWLFTSGSYEHAKFILIP